MLRSRRSFLEALVFVMAIPGLGSGDPNRFRMRVNGQDVLPSSTRRNVDGTLAVSFDGPRSDTPFEVSGIEIFDGDSRISVASCNFRGTHFHASINSYVG